RAPARDDLADRDRYRLPLVVGVALDVPVGAVGLLVAGRVARPAPELVVAGRVRLPRPRPRPPGERAEVGVLDVGGVPRATGVRAHLDVRARGHAGPRPAADRARSEIAEQAGGPEVGGDRRHRIVV